MPHYRKGGREVELDPGRRARLGEAMDRTPDERLELEQVRDWYARHRPGPGGAGAGAVPCFLPGQVEALGALVAGLRAERARRGLSLTDVSGRSGLTRAAISRLENGHRANPTLDTLYRYAHALGVTIALSAVETAPARTLGE